MLKNLFIKYIRQLSLKRDLEKAEAEYSVAIQLNKEEKEVLKDYEGLASLLRETKLLFKESGRVVTVAYYPDTRQVYLNKLIL